MLPLNSHNRFSYEVGDLLEWNSLYSGVLVGLVVGKSFDEDEEQVCYDIMWNKINVSMYEKKVITYTTYDLGLWSRIRKV